MSYLLNCDKLYIELLGWGPFQICQVTWKSLSCVWASTMPCTIQSMGSSRSRILEWVASFSRVFLKPGIELRSPSVSRYFYKMSYKGSIRYAILEIVSSYWQSIVIFLECVPFLFPVYFCNIWDCKTCFLILYLFVTFIRLLWLSGKESASNAGDARDISSIPGSGKIPRE